MNNAHAVGVRALKARLSECLRLVRAGDRLTVTDHGRVVAALVPAGGLANAEWAHAMVTAGRAYWSGGKPTGLPRRIVSRGKRASKMVIEDRR